MPIDYKNLYLYKSPFFCFSIESRFVNSGDRCWPFDRMEAETFLSLLYRYKNIKEFLNVYSAYKENFEKWNLLDLSKSALTEVFVKSVELNISCNQPLVAWFDWEIIVDFMLNSFISDGIVKFVKNSDLDSMSSKEIILKGSFHSLDKIISFDKQLFNKKGLKNLLLFLKVDIISANFIVNKTFRTKDLTLVKNFILNLISFQNTKSSFILTKVIDDFNVFFTDPSFDRDTFDQISKKLLENQYAELENFDVLNVFDSAEGSKSKSPEIFVNLFMNDFYKERLKQSGDESESKKILESFESYLLFYNKNILLLEAPEIENCISNFTLDREFEINSLIEQNKPFYNEILKKMSFARLLGGLLLQTLVVARSFGIAAPLPTSSIESSLAIVVPSISNRSVQPQNVTTSSLSAQSVQRVKMPKPFNDYYYHQEGKGIRSTSSKEVMTSKAIKQPNLVKNAKVAAEKALTIEEEINNRIKKGKRRGIFDVVINGSIVYTDIGEPIFLGNSLNTSMPYGQRQGIKNDLNQTLQEVQIKRSELGVIESNTIINGVILPKPNEVIIPSRLSPIKIEQEHISIEPLRKAFQITKAEGSSFTRIAEHHRVQTQLMSWILPPEFGYTSNKLDAIAWYAEFLKPLYLKNLNIYYDANPNEVHLLNLCGTNIEGVVSGASAAFDAEIEFLINRPIENKFLLPCSHVRLIANQASTEFESFGDKTTGAGHSTIQSTKFLEDGIKNVLPVLELCDCVYEQLIPGTHARAETGKIRQRLIDGISRTIGFLRELSASIDQTLLDRVENIMSNREIGKELTLERGEEIARSLKLGNVKEGVKRIWPNNTFRFRK